MFTMLKKIIQYPRVTLKYPKEPLDLPVIPGKPVLDPGRCQGCGSCITRCPGKAVVSDAETGKVLGIDLGACVFCYLCVEICPHAAVTVTREFELAAPSRAMLRPHTPVIIQDQDMASPETLAAEITMKAKKLFRRSLQIREVDAGSCNGCDYEINGLNNPFNDLERFGIHFVASPRHADMLLVTGTACRNMEDALIRTYEATPAPKLVAAVGACAVSGGIFRESHVTRSGIDTLIPVDVYIPGCPPRPQAILYGILKALERVK